MKVISIKQPWASLIINGYKKYEFRTWKTKYRGDILIHASKSFDKNLIEYFKDYNLEYPTGCIIGKVNLNNCVPVTEKFENDLIKKNEKVYGITHGRSGYAFELTNIQKFDNTIEVTGKLGIWNFDGILKK